MQNEVKFIKANWNAPKNINTLITTRIGGELRSKFGFNLAKHVDDNENTVISNRLLLTKLLPSSPNWLNQTHSDNVLNLDNQIISADVHSFDAAFTKSKNKVCAVLTADCIPILITDVNGQYIAAVHAGWRGVENNIIIKTIDQIKIPPKDVIAYIGPAICKDHFEVGLDVFEIFTKKNKATEVDFIPKGNNKYFCNLISIAQKQLLDIGVLNNNIYLSNICTYCENKLFYSYRKEKITGRFVSTIWIS